MTTALGAPASRISGRDWLLLIVIGLSQLMIGLDGTIINIALPDAQTDLGFGDSGRQWVVTAYTLALGCLLLIGGRVVDHFGHKRVLLTGLVGFAVVSAIGGAAPDFVVLVAARGLQGAFAALLAPSALALLTTTFTEERPRRAAFAFFGGIIGAGGATGLILGGVLGEFADWRWCLFVNLILAVPAIVGAAILAPRAHPGERHRLRLDFPGALTSLLGLFALVFGLSWAQTAGWGSAITIASIVLGVALLAVFVLVERAAVLPLLPLRVVVDRYRGSAYLTIAILAAGFFATFFFLSFFMQEQLRYTPLQSGLAFLPMVAAYAAVTSFATSRLLHRFGPRVLVVVGLIVTAIGLVMLTGITPDSAFVTAILPGSVVFDIGQAIAVAAVLPMATRDIDAGHAGMASSMVNIGQQIGTSISIAAFSTIAAGIAGPLASPGAVVDSYVVVFRIAAALSVFGAVLCGLLFPRRER